MIVQLANSRNDMKVKALETLIIDTLHDIKATDIVVIDVKQLTDIADYMIVCTGNSSRHVKSIANRIIENVKQQQCRPLGIEGEDDGEWILIDLCDIIVHIMQPKTRLFYSLEKLWSHPPKAIETQQ